MILEIDEDVKKVAEFIQRNMVAAKFVPVAKAVAQLAPILWAGHQTESIDALWLRSEPIN